MNGQDVSSFTYFDTATENYPKGEAKKKHAKQFVSQFFFCLELFAFLFFFVSPYAENISIWNVKKRAPVRFKQEILESQEEEDEDEKEIRLL